MIRPSICCFPISALFTRLVRRTVPLALLACSGLAAAQTPADHGAPPPSRPATQAQTKLHIDGVSAIQLAWWFQHIADDQGKYWKPLAPGVNRSIDWDLNPRDDAHQLIGSVFHVEQASQGDASNEPRKWALHLQFQDYLSNRGWKPGTPQQVFPSLAYPDDYAVPYPSPLIVDGMGTIDPQSKVNGFNEQLLLTDGRGYAPGRLLLSWVNTGADDTAAASGPVGVDLTLTLYQPWMEGANHPAGQADGTYFSPAGSQAFLGAWQATLTGLASRLPAWFNADTQDDQARAKGWTITSVIDTGVVPGVDSRMWVWWWNHAMGDAPGVNYIFWCPPAHYTIYWLPGYSAAEVAKSARLPTDKVVVGAIYPDLQLGDMVQPGGGMMSYPASMAPIKVKGRYTTIDPMSVVSAEQVANFARERYLEPFFWLMHQWGDVPGGVVHRSSGASRLPLRSPLTQQGFYFEHQMMEGLFWGGQGMRRAYANFLAAQKRSSGRGRGVAEGKAGVASRP